MSSRDGLGLQVATVVRWLPGEVGMLQVP